MGKEQINIASANFETGKESDQNDRVFDVLRLLSSAVVTARKEFYDEICQNSLEDCTFSLWSQYEFPDRGDSASPITEIYGDVAGFIRLLDFIRLEVAEYLDNKRCAELLSECVRRLIAVHGLAQENIYAGTVI